MRLIDADAYAAEMHKRQDACRKWKSEQNVGSETYARAEQAFVTFVEAWVTLEKQPTIPAIPVEWLEDRVYDMKRAPLYRRYAEMLLMEWLQEQKEQEAQD